MIKSKIFAITLLLFCTINIVIASAEQKYKISDIHSALKENAKVVIRKSDITINVNLNNIVEEYNLVFSILNKNGDIYSIFNEYYDKFSTVNNIRLTLYDSDGNKLKSYAGTDIIDMSAISNYLLYEDNRIKLINPKYKNYPFTVEINYTKKYKSLLFLNDWKVYPDYDCSIESTSLVINTVPNSEINFLEKNLPKKGSILKDKEGTHYSWKLENLKAFAEEDFEQAFEELIPIVYLSPKKFELENTIGDFDSWLNFGKWYASLLKGRDLLLPETTTKIKELTKDLTIYEKINFIYKYMQNKTRYVSIQIGIGGWQPFEASTVDRLGYGDCKALTNYTAALLKIVGIKSNHVIIKAGDNEPSLLTDFPSNSFNHVILMVPVNNDTIFLECTNPYSPIGHLGDFTDNRYALMISDSGGVIIKTKAYKQDENIISSNTSVNILNNGNCIASMKKIFSGTYFDDINYISNYTNDDIKEYLYETINIPDYSLNSYSFKQSDSTKPIIEQNININISNYASKTGNYLFLPINLSNRISEIPKIKETRKSNIVIKRYKTTFDTIIYTIPKEYVIEKKPLDNEFVTDFGSYHSKCIITDSTIMYIRKFNLTPAILQPNDAMKFKEFFKKVSTADMEKLTLKVKL